MITDTFLLRPAQQGPCRQDKHTIPVLYSEFGSRRRSRKRETREIIYKAVNLTSCRIPLPSSAHEHPHGWCAGKGMMSSVQTSTGNPMQAVSSSTQRLNIITLLSTSVSLFRHPVSHFMAPHRPSLVILPLITIHPASLQVSTDGLAHQHPKPHHFDPSLEGLLPVALSCALGRDVTPPQLQALPNSSAAFIGSLP